MTSVYDIECYNLLWYHVLHSLLSEYLQIMVSESTQPTVSIAAPSTVYSTLVDTQSEAIHSQMLGF